jgi:heme A synthase
MARPDSSPRLARFAWALLGYDVSVVAWGAYVRASGSGAGCGRHWPLCNGEFVPRAPRIETLVELSHRASAGVALCLTATLAFAAFRTHPRGHRVRRAAAAAAAFMVAEALIGAFLVLFELVAHDASVKRALSVSLHLVNTFLLLGSTTLTAYWASGGAAVRVRRGGALAWTVGLPLAAMLAVGATGAVNALGDTLFPSTSLAAGLALDMAPRAHWLVRVRALHPLLASATAAMVIVSAGIARARAPGQAVRRFSRAAALLAVVQVGAGFLDVFTLAPVAMQLAHLLLADLLWIAWVLTSATALAAPASAHAAAIGFPSLEGDAPATAPSASAPSAWRTR